MQLTKGAIGNLINRYKAVLKKCHLLNVFGSLAVAGMLVMGGASVAGAGGYGTAEEPSQTPITFTGEDITYEGDIYLKTSGTGVKFEQNTGQSSGRIHLGSDSSVIDIRSKETAVQIFRHKIDNVDDKGEISLRGKSVYIEAVNNTGWTCGIYAGSDVTTPGNTNNTLNISSTDGTVIIAKSGVATQAEAIVAHSGAIINIDGPLYVEASTIDGSSFGDAISTRGGATINIGKNGDSVKIIGNIEFDYDKSSSGTPVDAYTNIYLNGKDSFWHGNTVTSWDSQPDSDFLDVTEMRLTLTNGASWTPVAVNDSSNTKYAPLSHLKLDNGIVSVNKDVTVTIEDISGSGTITNAGTMSLGTTGTGELGGTIDNTGSMNITGATTLARGSSYTQSGEGSLTVEQGAHLTNNGTMTINGGSLTVNGTATFADGSLLAVNGNNLTGNNAAITVGNSGTLDVKDKARLRIDNAQNGQKVSIVDGSTSTWKEIEAGTDLLTPTMDDNGDVTFSRDKDASDVFVGMDGNTAAMLNTLIDKGLNNTDDDEMGVRFLSRTVEKTYLGADKDAAAATIESAARIAFAGAVPQMTKMASDAGSNAVVNRLGFANPADGAQAMDAEGKIVDRNTTGFALWIAPLWQSQHGWGMEAGNLDYGFNGNLGGVSLGADYTFENAIRAGITFNIGGGYAESSGGDLNSTENRMSFWGLGAYAGWNYENFGLMADVSYTSTWNDLKQDMDSRMGMGDLEADVQASAISAGLRAEYKLETSVLDVIPHIGVRYMSLNTWGFDAESNGGTVLEGDGFHQDIWTFPVGVTFTKDFTLDSGWSFKPSIDFSVIPAAGDIKAKQDVAFTGLPGSYEVETQMMDYLTWQGGVGLEMGNDTMSFGVNYTLQAGQHTTGHGVFGSFRYEF